MLKHFNRVKLSGQFSHATLTPPSSPAGGQIARTQMGVGHTPTISPSHRSVSSQSSRIQQTFSLGQGPSQMSSQQVHPPFGVGPQDHQSNAVQSWVFPSPADTSLHGDEDTNYFSAFAPNGPAPGSMNHGPNLSSPDLVAHRTESSELSTHVLGHELLASIEQQDDQGSGSNSPQENQHMQRPMNGAGGMQESKQGQGQQKPKGKGAQYKTLPCLFFARGYCFRDEACTFIHDSSIHLAQAQDIWRQYRQRLIAQGTFRINPCKHWERNGYCNKKDMCTFRHVGCEDEEEELRRYGPRRGNAGQPPHGMPRGIGRRPLQENAAPFVPQMSQMPQVPMYPPQYFVPPVAPPGYEWKLQPALEQETPPQVPSEVPVPSTSPQVGVEEASTSTSTDTETQQVEKQLKGLRLGIPEEDAPASSDIDSTVDSRRA